MVLVIGVEKGPKNIGHMDRRSRKEGALAEGLGDIVAKRQQTQGIIMRRDSIGIEVMASADPETRKQENNICLTMNL